VFATGSGCGARPGHSRARNHSRAPGRGTRLIDEALLTPDHNRVTVHPTRADRESCCFARRRSTLVSSCATMLRGAPLNGVHPQPRWLWAGPSTYFRSRWTRPEVDEMILSVPFDFLHQALVACRRTWSDPKTKHSTTRSMKSSQSVARRVGRRTLVLFTSTGSCRRPLGPETPRRSGRGADPRAGHRRSAPQLLKAFEEAERPLLSAPPVLGRDRRCRREAELRDQWSAFRFQCPLSLSTPLARSRFADGSPSSRCRKRRCV